MIQIYIKTKKCFHLFLDPIHIYNQKFGDGIETVSIVTNTTKREFTYSDILEFEYEYENSDQYDFLEVIKNQIMEGK